METYTVKVRFTNGDSLFSTINGSADEVLEYYRKGRVFNLGKGELDYMVTVAEVEFI